MTGRRDKQRSVRRPIVRSMVVDFGEPAMFGAGPVTMSVDSAVSLTDSAWDAAVSDALAARDDHADETFEAAAFAGEAFEAAPFSGDTNDAEEPDEDELSAANDSFDDDPGHEDFEELEDHDDQAAREAAEADADPGEDVALAKSHRGALLDDDGRFWSVARAADDARTALARDPELAEIARSMEVDPETEADDELRRDLAELQQPPAEPSPAEPSPAEQSGNVASAHSVFDQMTMATTFDVGTFEVTRTFDALDAELDRQDRVRTRAIARAAADAEPAPVDAAPDPDSASDPAAEQAPVEQQPAELEDTVEDLAWIRTAIAQTREPSPPPIDVPSRASDPGDHTESRSAP